MAYDKKVYRKQLRGTLSQISEDQLSYFSKIICTTIVNLHCWKESRTVGVTMSFAKEIDTCMIIERGWQANKIICVPKTEPEARRMDFYKIDDFSQVESGYHGIREPIVHQTTKVDSACMDTLIIPCVGFDNKGFRIGYGGGFFDRYLENFNGLTCGIALECQKVDQVPTNRFDIPLDMIVTEQQVYRFSEKG